jgi:hypothetical protein
MFTGAWFLGAWGTYFIVKVRKRSLKELQQTDIEKAAAGYNRKYKLTLRERKQRLARLRKIP